MDSAHRVLYISYMASLETEGNELRPPQYLDEVEALVGLPAYADPDTEARLINGELPASPAELGARALLYTNSLRVLAKARREDRRLYGQQYGEVDSQAFNEQWAQTLTVKGIARIAQAYEAEVSPIVRRLHMQHNIERSLQDETLFEGLRGRQPSYLEDIVTFLQAGPSKATYIDDSGEEKSFSSQGGIVDAPTGVGKTVMIARTVDKLGIGKKLPANTVGYQQPLRALLIVPTRDLVRQYKGETGDDTFRHFVPGVSVDSYYSREKLAGADVVVATEFMFMREFRDGQLDEETFDIMLIDEAHHLTSKRFQETFRQHWKGPALGFTATPAYSLKRDVRKLLPHVIYHGDTLSYIKDGALNDARLRMFRVDPRQHRALLPKDIDFEDSLQRREAGETIMNQAIVERALELMKAGRRGMIFCGYGDKSLQARTIAELLSEAVDSDGQPVVLPDGKRIRAEATGSFRDRVAYRLTNREIREAYDKGDVHVVTTTSMGIEGLNAEVDFVIVAGRIASLLKFKQLVGRGTRLSERFPETVYEHFFIAPEGNERSTRTLYEAFGLEEVDHKMAGGAPPDPVPKSRHFFSSLERMSAQINLIPVAETTASNKGIEIPEDYVSIIEMAEAIHYEAATTLKYVLTSEGFAWIGRLEEIGGEQTFVRYYEPAAYEFLKMLKRLPSKTKEMVSVMALAKELDVPRSFLDECIANLIEQGSVTLKTYRAGGLWRGAYLNLPDQARVKQHIKEVVASPTDMTCAGIGRLAGIASSGAVKQLMSAEEFEQSQVKYVWRGDEARTGRFKTQVWSQESGARIAERLKDRNKSLPPHLLNIAAIASALPVTRRVAITYLHSLEPDPVRIDLPGAGPKTSCLSWTSFKTALERYKSTTAFKIDFNRLPRAHDDTDPERVAYARGVQYLCVADPKRLGLSPMELELAKEMADKIKRGEI